MFSKSATIGNQTELMFDVLVQSKGWYVGYPYNDTMLYDRIISDDNGINWKTIQIKTARRQSNGTSWGFSLQNNNGESYLDACDGMAVNVNGMFFMFPSSFFNENRKSYTFCPNNAMDFLLGCVVITNELR